VGRLPLPPGAARDGHHPQGHHPEDHDPEGHHPEDQCRASYYVKSPGYQNRRLIPMDQEKKPSQVDSDQKPGWEQGQRDKEEKQRKPGQSGQPEQQQQTGQSGQPEPRRQPGEQEPRRPGQPQTEDPGKRDKREDVA